MKLFLVTILGAASTVVAAAAQHHHKHRHVGRLDEPGSPVEKRNPMVTEIVPGPTETVYQLQNGEDLTYDEVMEGIKEGKYVLIADTPAAPSTTVAPAVPTSTIVPTTLISTTSTASESPAAFVQLSASLALSVSVPSTTAIIPTTSSTSSTSSTSTSTTSTSTTSSTSTTIVPTTTSSAAPTTTSKASSVVSSTPLATTAANINEDFPSGKIACSEFPSAYGAVYLDWLNLDGWAGIQETPNYSPGDADISYISSKTSGGCTANTFCSYACPAGYQKSQWPVAQGNTGQSIGGLYCNADGMLEISNTNFSTICIEGTGTISVKNTLSEQVVICRTDYPGFESETIPLIATAGGEHPLTCPDASNYFMWEDKPTSAQYYINPAGATVEDACVWGEAGTDLGNWAPVNMGVGKGIAGSTFISLFPNSPTNPTGVLDFTITVKGDISGTCSYSHGTYYDSNGENPSGCTVGVTGTAYYELSS